MKTWRKVGCCLIAVVCGVLSARAEIPETTWTVTEPAKADADATFTEPTGWGFKLNKSGQLTKTAQGTATALNFRTLELECGYQIVSMAQRFLKGNAVVEELYFPSTLASVSCEGFAGCSNLKVFSVPENNITTIDYSGFQNCSKLEELPIGNSLTTLGKNAFLNCTVAKAPAGMKVLPDSCVNFPTGWNVIGGCKALTGTVYIAGDDKTNFSLGETRGALTGSGVQELVLGAALTAGNTATYGFTWAWSEQTLTNVVIRNPDVFAIGSNDFSPTYTGSILTYDIAGWITGVAGGAAYKVCYLVNRSVPNWAAWAADPNNYTLWEDCTSVNQQKYWDAHNGGVEGDDPPFALTKKVTFEGLQFQANYWVKFKKETATKKTMIVHVDEDEKDCPSADPVRFPEYSVPCGSTDDMDLQGYEFPLDVTAPEYIVAKTALSNNLWRVVGGEMEELNYETLEYEHYATINGASYTFNPGRNGIWKLRWNTILAGASITIDETKIQELGSIDIDKVPDVQIGIGYYAPGTVVQVAATPVEGARFVRWFGDFPEGGMSNSVITVTMDAGKTLQPWFEPARYELTTTPIRNPEGASVTAVPAPGEDGKYPADEMVMLTANDGDPAHPFRMWGFQDGLSHPDYTNRTITVCVEKAKKVRPIYAYKSWFYDGTYVIDGGWKIKKASVKNETQISVAAANSEANWDFAGDHELDMKKPIYDANGNEYTFYGFEGDMFRSEWTKPLVAQIETLRFGRDQTTVYGGYAFHVEFPFLNLYLWEISASQYTKASSPNPFVIYFSSPDFSSGTNLNQLPCNGDYKQIIRLNPQCEMWRNFMDDPTKVTRWRKLTDAQRAKFDPSYFSLPAGYHPYGLILSNNGIFRQLLWVEPDRKPGLLLIFR